MDYALEAKNARLKVLDLIYKAGTSHTGSNFSCTDILTVLFDKIDLSKDVFVLSAGWKAASLYYFLWKKGRITEEELNSFCQEGSPFIGLAEPIVPEIKIAGGSMGLGLPGAVGLALSKKLKKEEGMVYCLMSDGELQCGTTWESALIAGHHKLDNLTVLVDCNGLQAMGKTGDILRGGRWYHDGWKRTDELDMVDWGGHHFGEIEKYLNLAHDRKWRGGLAYVIFFPTRKGFPVSFMTDNNLYHYAKLTKEDYEKAKEELNG